jgi:hypothetical protein
VLPFSSHQVQTTLDSLVVLLTPASGIPAVERIIDTLLLFTEEADCHPALAQHAQLELALAAVIEDVRRATLYCSYPHLSLTC